jgi:hypothetical protein
MFLWNIRELVLNWTSWRYVNHRCGNPQIQRVLEDDVPRLFHERTHFERQWLQFDSVAFRRSTVHWTSTYLGVSAIQECINLFVLRAQRGRIGWYLNVLGFLFMDSTLWVLLKRNTCIRRQSKIQPRCSYIYFEWPYLCRSWDLFNALMVMYFYFSPPFPRLLVFFCSGFWILQCIRYSLKGKH